MAQYNKTVKATGTQFFNDQPQKHTPGKWWLTERESNMHLIIQIYWMIIGPGSYNYTNGFDQIKTAMQNAKTLQNFGLD